MKLSKLKPVENSNVRFFDDKPTMPISNRYKIYHYGGHYVATLSNSHRGKDSENTKKRERKDIEILFDSLFLQARKEGLRDGKFNKPMTGYIKSGICKLFDCVPDVDKYVEKGIKRRLNNILHRKKRFRRKGYLNRWNYFVTFTYSNGKQTESSFRKKLRKCLSNLHTRRGWKYMGVFEYAPETGRLHFHGLLYVPDGEMLGKIYEKQDYSTAQQKMQTTHPNTFFEENFGRNDFEELTETKLRRGNTIDYILKYIGKTGERIVYSRGIPTEIEKEIRNNEILSEFFDFVTKFVVSETAISWETDIIRYNRARQMSIIDIMCNPPQTA